MIQLQLKNRITNSIPYSISVLRKNFEWVIFCCILLLLLANVVVDFAVTIFRNSSFYLSESLLFSSYWLMYVPILFFLIKKCLRTKGRLKNAVLAVGVVLFHLILYPALVWIISATFYENTFEYWQTFNFGLSTYFVETMLIYGLVLIVCNFTSATRPVQECKVSETVVQQRFISSILVTEGNNKTTVLSVNEVLYFSANPPYISIYHRSKKYLQSTTLKSLEQQLNPTEFVRIHKSHIVNMGKVQSIHSRQNGDYDIQLCDGTTLRLSRNFAKNFKSQLLARPQVSQ